MADSRSHLSDLQSSQLVAAESLDSFKPNTNSQSTKSSRLLHPYLGIWNSSDHETWPLLRECNTRCPLSVALAAVSQ